MIVNEDYKNWHLAYYCKNFIMKNIRDSDSKYCIIHENNKYINFWVKDMENVTILETLSVLPTSDYYIICCKIENPDYKRILSYCKNIIDIYQDYLTYELPKTPVNYIVDEYRMIDNGYYKKYIHEKDLLATDYVQQYIENRYDSNGNLKLFNKIEIETINKCNNNCSFCPANCNDDIRPLEIMSDDMYENIISQLAKLNYTGALGLFSNNEPLLDKKILNRCKLARNKLPHVYLYIYTNGILLTPEILSELLKYLDYIYIDNYNDLNELIGPLKNIYQYLLDNRVDPAKISIHLRNKTEVLSSRGGKAPNKTEYESIKSSCILPFSQIIIQPSGKVSLCCNDVYGQIILGDVNEHTLDEIWYNEKYKEIRQWILQGRQCLNICKHCDTLFTPLPFERI